MTIKELAESLALECVTPEIEASTAEVTGGYVSDLLSDVLAHAPNGGVLVTIQVHLNVVAVAVHAELTGVILASGRRPDDAVRERAIEEGVALYCTNESAFEIVGRLYALGLRGPKE